MSDHPQYYRITDSLEALSIRIRLRKIFGRSVNATREKIGGDGADRVLGAFVPGDEADLRVKWQEKVFGPQEIIMVSSRQQRHRHHRTKQSQKRPLSRLERDYAGHVEDLERQHTDPLALVSEVMLYTYTDKDGFIPPSQANGRGLTTGDGGPFSYLEEAVVNMPRTVATSSLDAESSGGVGGGGAQPGAAAAAGKGADQTGVSETAGVIQAHLAREDKFKMMYIVAAVDVDVREAKRVAKANATPAEGAGNGVAQRGAEGPGSRWRRGDEGRIHVHEQVVCSIKAHQNGTLEIAPGFSAEEPESGDEGAFLTDHTVKVMDKEGARLTTYQFTSPSGGVFSYTVENNSEPRGGVEEMEEWEAEEASRDQWKKAAREQVAGAQLLGAPGPEGAVVLHAFLEIVSASGFEGVARLYTEYALSLPRHWKLAGEAGGDGGSLAGRGEEGAPGCANTGDAHAEFAAGGTTQVACQTYPLGVPNCPPANNNNNGKPRLGSRGSLTPSMSSSASSSNTTRYGSSTMPSVFIPSSRALPGYARRAAAAALLCFLGLLLSLGASPMFWVVFGAAIVVIATLCDSGDGGGGDGAGVGPVAHFGFPAEFQLLNEEEGDIAGIGERPQVLLAVSSLDNLARHRVEGYGYVTFPRQPGAHELLVRTWRPICSLRSHLQDFFVGGAHRLHDPRYASKPGGFKGSFLSRFGFRTETSGNLRLRLHLVEQGRVRESRAGEPFGPGGARGGPSVDLAGTRTVKEILRAVNAKRLSVEIARRFSATVDSASSTNTDATASVGTDGSTAPAAAAVAVGEVGRKKIENMGTAESTEGGAHGGNSLGRGNYSTQPELHPRNPPERTERGGRGGKLGAANELLARVRGQLERSEQRTKGAPGERGVGHDIAPQR